MKVKFSGGKKPSMRANHNWTSVLKPNRFLNKLGIGSSIFTFKCGYRHYDIKLKGVHVDKLENHLVMDKAHFMRRAGERFYFLVDLSEHGVNKTSRERGGYYLYTFEKMNNKWRIKRHYYSLKDVEPLKLDGLMFHNVYWRIIRYCYYGEAIEGDNGGDNSG